MLKLLLVLFLLLPVFPQQVHAAENRDVRVGWVYQPGYQELDGKGQPSGFNYEYLMEIANYTGWTYDFITTNAGGDKLTWGDSLSMLESGALDIAGCLLYTDERAEVYAYPSLPAGQMLTSLFVKNDSPLTNEDLVETDGITVAASMATQNDEDLSSYAEKCGFVIKEFMDCATLQDVIDAVLDGKVDAGVIGNYQPGKGTRIIASFSPRAFYFATTKGNTRIYSALEQALTSIFLSNPYYAQELATRYQLTYSESTVLSAKELEFIKNSEPIKVCFNEAWYPMFAYNDTTGEASGVIADILNHISEFTGLKFTFHRVGTFAEAQEQVSSGQCDILACCTHDMRLATESNILLTDTYLSIQLVRVGNASATQDDYRIGTLKDFLDYDKAIQGENVSYHYYATSGECFEALRKGEVDDIVVNSYSAGHYLSLTKYTRYVRTALQGMSIYASMGVSNASENGKILRSVLNKALANITEAEKNGYILSNTLKDGSSFEAMINRIPTTTAVVIILALVLLILLLAAFFIVSIRKSKQSRRASERINQLLVRDELTGTLNENGFNLSARKSLDDYPDRSWFLVDFDVEGFEHINMLLGFATGNEILTSVARITTESFHHAGELCGRIYADHFVCIVTGNDIEEIKSNILKVNTAFRTLEGHNPIQFCYGIYPIIDTSMPIVTMRDMAQAAKRMVKGHFDQLIGVFNEVLHKRQNEDAQLVADMENGIQNGEFVAYYQPKYDILTEKIVGAEALVRWRHGDQLVRPDRFISLFEKNGQINQLDFFMLETVCKKFRTQLDAGRTPLPVSINFARNHLYDASFLDDLQAMIQRYSIPPELLIVEFTESVCLENEDLLSEVINRIHTLGLSVSIDDFGSGYSSLNMLKDMNFDELKLDKGFLRSTAEIDRGRAIIVTILSLAKQLNLKTVAEGVEEKDQLEFLRENGCDTVQGFYFSPPVPEEKYDELLGE